MLDITFLAYIFFIRGSNGGPAAAQAGPDSDDEVPYETKGFDYGKYALVSKISSFVFS